MICWSCLLSIGGCVFDDDVQYIPEPIAGYWMLQDEQDQSLSILKVLTDDELVWDYETRLAINAGMATDLDLLDDELVISIASEQKILTFGLPDETLLNTYTVSPINPHLVAIGKQRIAAVDTSSATIIWINRNDGSIIEDSLGGVVEQLYYMEPYFFLLEDSLLLKVWEENTLSQVEETIVPSEVSSVMKFERLNRIQLISEKGGEYKLYSWDFGPQVLAFNGVKIYNKIAYTPYRRQETGREWTEDIELRGDFIPSLGLAPAEDFTTQFLTSQLYYHHTDSLWRVDMPSRARRFLTTFPYQIKQSRFYP